ncbi:MAG: hypothetical protein M3125_09155 [Gemmatimonadota bacterium]|nr:hypothetical protein [Gemmatimonadota bacterium]
MSEVLERRTVSRKTARDGKHEISPGLAARLRKLADELDVIVDGVADRASIASMPCTCQGPEAHEHWFLESNALRGMEAGREARMALGDDGRTLEISTE